MNPKMFYKSDTILSFTPADNDMTGETCRTRNIKFVCRLMRQQKEMIRHFNNATIFFQAATTKASKILLKTLLGFIVELCISAERWFKT